VVKAEWVDPGDIWTCACDCDDPSEAGAVISAPIQGCARMNLIPGNAEDERLACEDVCGGRFCGASPGCEVGFCQPPDPSVGSQAQLVARGVCDPTKPAPLLRVADAGDYHVTLSPLSSVTVRSGRFDTTEQNLSGEILFNLSDDGDLVDISRAFVSAPTLDLRGLLGLFETTIEQGVAFSSRRTIGSRTGSSFVIPAGLAAVVAQGVVDGERKFLLLDNSEPVVGSFDLATNLFTMDIVGQEGTESSEVEVRLHLVGRIDNVPPVADGSRTQEIVECSAPALTPVTLDGTASSDPDAGDAITYYQWFLAQGGEDGEGRGNEAQQAVALPLGRSDFFLHVYDQDLSAAQTAVSVDVVDTTPPSLSLSPSELCLWAPNHRRVRFRLLSDISVAASDVCDASTEVSILSVQSNEPDNGLGDGNTSDDISFSEEAVCVRGERSGTGEGRTYTVTIQARDDSGNTTTKPLLIRVPHSHEPGCKGGPAIPDDAPCE
jgi:hypothetical protein